MFDVRLLRSIFGKGERGSLKSLVREKYLARTASFSIFYIGLSPPWSKKKPDLGVSEMRANAVDPYTQSNVESPLCLHYHYHLQQLSPLPSPNHFPAPYNMSPLVF